MPTVRQSLVGKLLDHICAEVEYPALVMVREIPGLAPPWQDALPENKPSVRGVGFGMRQCVCMGLRYQSGHDVTRQMAATDLSQAKIIADPKRLMEQIRNNHAVNLWAMLDRPEMLDRPFAGPLRAVRYAASQDHLTCLFLRSQIQSGQAVDNWNALGTTHGAGWHDDLRLVKRPYPSPPPDTHPGRQPVPP